jgi:hypothetical protein
MISKVNLTPGYQSRNANLVLFFYVYLIVSSIALMQASYSKPETGFDKIERYDHSSGT